MWCESEWIRVEDCLPASADADQQGCVQVWHVYNGVMMMQWHLVHQHGTVTHWKRAPLPPPDHAELRRKYKEGIRK